MPLALTATSALFTAISMASASPVPHHALERESARLWHVDFSVALRSLQIPDNTRPFRMPLITDGPWSHLAKPTLRVESGDGNAVVTTLVADQGIRGQGVQGEDMVTVPVVTQTQRPGVIRVSAECATFSSKLDESLAQQAAWPTQWPAGTRAALEPQPLIESDDPIFAQAIQSLFGTDLKMVPPYLAAKRIIQYCCDQVVVSGTPMLEYSNRVRGLNLRGAVPCARDGRGFQGDLVCVCVAMLRAAGIPARPVVGITMVRRDAEDLRTWAEFYLPGSGWVPFSPDDLQGAGVRSWKIDRPWRYLGTWPDLDEHLPLAWSFAPGDGSTAHDAWAIFGWTRLDPGGAFPVPESVTPRDSRSTDASPRQTAQVMINVISGGSLSERDYQSWLEGQRRPVASGRSRP